MIIHTTISLVYSQSFISKTWINMHGTCSVNTEKSKRQIRILMVTLGIGVHDI